MAKKTATPLISVKRTRTSAYQADFDHLKAEILRDAGTGAHHQATDLAVDKLRRGRYQPRSLAVEDPSFNDLVQSIRELGIIEPLAVRPLAGQPDSYEILAGDRRWRAAQKAGLDQVPVIVHDVDDRTAAAIALVENLQREDLNPIEEAIGVQRLMENFSLTQAQAGELVGRSESAVSKSLGLLKLAPRIQEMIQRGELEAGHGKVLLGMAPEEQQLLAERAFHQGWSVRELEKQKAALASRGRRKKRPLGDDRDANLKHLEAELGEWFCAPVKIRPGRQGGGKIEITYASVEECEHILQRFGFKNRREIEK